MKMIVVCILVCMVWLNVYVFDELVECVRVWGLNVLVLIQVVISVELENFVIDVWFEGLEFRSIGVWYDDVLGVIDVVCDEFEV